MRKPHPWLFGLLVAFFYGVSWSPAISAQPGWWTDSTNGTAIIGGNTANNLAPANLGQLKYVATQAKQYLDFKLSANGGAGPGIDTLVSGFSYGPDNYAIVNNGQVKYVAQMFYDRMFALGYNISNSTLTVDGLPGNWTFTGGNISGNIYPWLWVAPGGTSPAWQPPGPFQSGYNGTTYSTWLQNQYAPANLGQLKYVFSFDLGNTTSTDVSNYTANNANAPTSGNYRGRVLSSAASGTDDGDDQDDNFTITDTSITLPSLTVPQYSVNNIGTGQLVDMDGSGDVLLAQTEANTYDPTILYPATYTFWNNALYSIPQTVPLPYGGEGYGKNNDNEPDLNNYLWIRASDDGTVLGALLDSDNSIPAYWRPGMTTPYVLDDSSIDWSFVNTFYADNGGNIYFEVYGYNDEGYYEGVYEWATSTNTVQFLGNVDDGIWPSITLAQTGDYTLTATLDEDDESADLAINGHNITTIVDHWDASWEAELLTPLVRYAHQFTEWGNMGALGGDAPNPNSMVFSDGSSATSGNLTPMPGAGSAEYITSVSSLGIATAGDGNIWADDQTWAVGAGIWVDQVTDNDEILVGHYGSNSTMDNTTSIVLLTPNNANGSIPTSDNESTTEASGAAHRKIALNGRPLPDGKPQTAPESDHQPEETFIDALTQGLRHNVTDIYTPVAGTDLPLSVTRVYNEEIWDVGAAGLQPTEHYLQVPIYPGSGTYVAHTDWPFGPAWRSNITPNVRLEYTSGNVLNAYVTDEDGDQYQFIGGFINIDPATGNYSATPYFNFVPYPTSQHEKNTFLATLAVDGNRTLVINSYNGTFANLTFAKKYGTNITYTYASNLTQAATTAPGSLNETFIYYRAAAANDRLGYQLNYHYPSATALVPDYINMQDATGGNIAGAYMNITTFSGNVPWEGLVENITDGDGRKTSYTYGNFTDSANVTTAELTTVTDAAGGNVTYGYDMATEPDQTPHPYGYTGHVAFYDHLELANITDQDGNAYGFNYGFSYGAHSTSGFYNYNGNTYYPATGRPRLVEQVTMPNGANVTLASNISVRVADDGVSLSLQGGPYQFARNLTVTDADGNVITYTWADSQLVDEGVPVALQNPNSPTEPFAVLYQKMTIDFGNIGGTDLSETYYFDPAAGMALLSATDMSGETTEYTYGDAWAAPAWYKQVLPDLADLEGNYDDPTEEIDPNGGVKTFTYNSLRLMSDIVDPNGNLTHYIFDNGGNLTKGLRTAEQHYVGNTTGGTLVAETDYTYGNTSFPGALTQKNVQSVDGDPDWAANLTTNYTLTDAGRVEEEIVNPAGLALTTSHTYSNTGDLLSTTDPLGNTTNMTYDNRHRLTQVAYPDSSTKDYTYDARGNELSEEDEDGHFTLKDYDSLNRLASATRVVTGGNLTTSYSYSNTSARLTVTDPNDHTTSYTYDGLNRLTSMSTPEVEIDGNMTAVALTTTYAYNATLNPGGSVFDSSSFKPTSVTDPRGYVSNYTYDPLGRVTNEQVAYNLGDNLSTNVTYAYDPNDNLTEKMVQLDDYGEDFDTDDYAYDALNRLLTTTHEYDDSTIVANYTSTGLAYLRTDELGRETQTEYDAAGRPTAVLQPDPSSGNITGSSPTTTTTYDANGNALSVEDPDGNTIDYAYNSRNRRTKTTFPAAADWLNGGNSTAGNTTTAYDAVGNVLAVTNQLGQTTSTVYDAANRPTDVFTPAVGVWNGTGTTSLDLVTHTIYDANGNVLEVQQGTATGNSTGDEAITRNTTTNEYDALNRLTQTTDAANITVAYEYDAAANRVLVTDGLGQNTSFTYDGLNRVLTETDALSNVVTYAYGPTHVDSITLGNASSDSYTYDQRDRLQNDSYFDYYYDYAGEKTAAVERSSEYSYAGYFLPYFSNTYYSYDGDGRVIRENQGGDSPEGDLYGNESYYDIFDPSAYGGNLSTVTGGYANTYTYDQAGNRLSVTYGAGVSGNRTLNSVYDTLNRVANITDVAQFSGNLVTTYHYDLAGHRVGLLYPSGSNITTTFDALGRQTAITGSRTTTTPYSFNLTYDQYNNLAQQVETYQTVALGLSNRTVTLSYDNADRLTGEVLGVTNSTSVTTNITSSYTYDAAFNRTKKLTTQQIGTGNLTITTVGNISYHYNAANELTYWFNDAYGNGTWSGNDTGANYTYDTAGNRITQEYKAQMPEPGNTTNAPYITTNTTYSYIQVGRDNFLTVANLTTGWWKSGSNKLQQVAEYSAFSYDDQGRRQFEDRYDYYDYDTDGGHTGYGTIGGNYSGTYYSYNEPVTVKLHDGVSPVRAYTLTASSTGNTGNLSVPAEDWLRGSDWGGGIGGILYSQVEFGNATTASYYHYDGRGDVVALTSNTGNVTYAAAYNAYGTHAVSLNATTNVTITGTQEVGTDLDPFRTNTREEWDSADGTAFVKEGHRIRGLETDTYLTRDPLGQAAGTNYYTYVLQDEWTKFDPDGREALTLGAGVLALGDAIPEPAEPVFWVLTGLTVIGGGAVVVHNVENSAPAPAPAAAAPAPQPAAAQPPIVPPPPDGDDPEGSSQKDKKDAQDKVHGNSNSSTNPQHGYEIYEVEPDETGKQPVQKPGISGQELNDDGSSPRANRQVNKLNKDAGYMKYDSNVTPEVGKTRAEAKEWEQIKTNQLDAEGHPLELHKLPRPQNPPTPPSPPPSSPPPPSPSPQ